MMQTPIQLVRSDYDTAWFEALFAALDQLHDAASAGQLGAASPLAVEDMVGWLGDIIYTAEQTIVEIRDKYPVTGQ